ncbi:hypothetical protein WOLCODRAFT_161555 [Wolfiporia cocos MD-104 SS10]|uniref:Sterol regulatory element-binding protein cleavage-activating protein n=1 Tax=Wolfiporia cocos (strain MD-104) TaxID=742152 RepID=A0A2H3JF46_WOLCO|nr:hypothetical protein WOLCODRAFT_161555 [Wolfiporia cocos MD-104 SS10]
MYSLPTPPLLQRARTYGSHFFHRFGIHCATHQIRLILVSSIVITSLLFPAIAIYTSPETHFFAGFTLRVLDTFLTPDDISSYFAQHDLRDPWVGHSALRVREDSVARVQCGTQGILRAERVLIGSVSQEYGIDALDVSTLQTALQIEDRISRTLAPRGIPCLKTPAGSCFSLSPLAFWNHDEEALLSDRHILDTINLSQNITVSGVSIGPEMVFAGRELADPTASYLDSAMFLALTYLFPDRDCLGNAGHYKWLRVLEEAAGWSGDLVVQAQTPKLIALEYDKSMSTKSRLTFLSVFCYSAYLAFVVYTLRFMRRTRTVHSRIGLAATGIIELVVSTITSLSVCALVGFRVTMVPWELFPIIVSFIGVENMFQIVDAVLKTPITIPVKDRIAVGLSQAGTSNTLKVVSYNAVLGVIAFFSSGAIRQFCAFSIVVLVAHWFLVHTFFVTVLSIDIQRLELDELLRQNTNLSPTDLNKSTQRPTLPPAQTWRQALTAVKNTIRGRPGKNISLFLLLAITATLWVATSPSSTHHDARHHLRHQMRQTHKITPTDRVSPAFRLWQILNPADDALVHVRVESPTILVLAPEEDVRPSQLSTAGGEGTSRVRSSKMSRAWSRMIRPIWWLMKIMVVPIAGTTILLYGLLLYLLKNVELLEAQRQKPEPESASSEEGSSVEGEIAFTTLPRAFQNDVELIASSNDRRIVATIGLENEFVIWRTMPRTHQMVDTSDILLGNASTSSTASATLTSIAVHESGALCAVGTGSGLIGVWSIGRDEVKPCLQLFLDNTTSAAVTQLYFTSPRSRPPSPVRPLTPSPPPSESSVNANVIEYLYAAYENGTTVRWELDSTPKACYVTPSRSASITKTLLLPIRGEDRLLVGFCLDDGTFELSDLDGKDKLIPYECWIAAGNPHDLVCKADVCFVDLDGTQHTIIAAATQAGVVSLWDAGTRECLFILEESYGNINHLRLTAVNQNACSTCGELPCENFLVSFSVGQVILFYRAYLYLPTRRCSCPRNQPQHSLRASGLGRRSRSGSTASLTSLSGSATPRSHSRAPSFSLTSSALNPSAMFPVSAHGVHSRRTTEKDGIRRNHETLFVSADADESDPHPVGPVDVTPAAGAFPSQAPASIWQSLVVVRVAETTFERGCWDVAGDKIVGVRRRARAPFARTHNDRKGKVQVIAESPHGLSADTLERWELWTFDPADSKLHCSPLSALNCDVEERTSQKRKRENSITRLANGRTNSPLQRRRNESLVPRLHFTRVTPLVSSPAFCLAGFGNTVGLFDFSWSRMRHRRSSADIIRKLRTE